MKCSSWLIPDGNFATVFQKFASKNLFQKISQNSQENICAKSLNFIKKETVDQVFSFEFYQIFQNIFFIKHLWTTVSDVSIFTKKMDSNNTYRWIKKAYEIR